MPRSNPHRGWFASSSFSLSRLFLSALFLSSSVRAAKFPGELTPETFAAQVGKGHWFIEHFSPYCGHCTQFAPTWEKLVGEAEKEIPDVTLAKIDCIVHGGELLACLSRIPST